MSTKAILKVTSVSREKFDRLTKNYKANDLLLAGYPILECAGEFFPTPHTFIEIKRAVDGTYYFEIEESNSA